MAASGNLAMRLSVAAKKKEELRRATIDGDDITDSDETATNGGNTFDLSVAELARDFHLTSAEIDELPSDYTQAQKDKMTSVGEIILTEVDTNGANCLGKYITPHLFDVTQHVELTRAELEELTRGLKDDKVTYTYTNVAESYLDLVRDQALLAVTECTIEGIEKFSKMINEDIVLPDMQEQLEKKLSRELGFDQNHQSKSTDPKLLEAEQVMEICHVKLRTFVETMVKTQANRVKKHNQLQTLTAEMNDGDDDNDVALEKCQKKLKAIDDLVTGQKHDIFGLMAETYSGVASSDAHSKHDSLAKHTFELDESLYDHTLNDKRVSDKLLADTLMVCQTWIKEFYPLIPIITMMNQNTDPMNAIKFPTIAEAVTDSWFGPALGSVYNQSSSMLFELFARSNPQMIHLASNPLEVGGNGDPKRSAAMEESNGVSLLAYYNLVHLQDLADKCRSMSSIIRSSYSLFVEGPISTACDVWLSRWRDALEYGVDCPWHETILKGSELLRRRKNQQDLWQPMTEWMDMKVTPENERDCKALIGRWIASIQKIANKMGNDNPGAVDNAVAKQQLAQMHAFVAASGGQPPKSGGGGNQAAWTCGKQGCNAPIPHEIKEITQKKAGEKLGRHPNSIENPHTVLCTPHNDKFVGGEDMMLKTGEKKYRFPKQSGGNKPPAQQQGKQQQEKLTDEQRTEKKRLQNRARRAKAKVKKAAEKKEEPTKPDSKSGSLSSGQLAEAIVLLQSVGIIGGAVASPVVEKPEDAAPAPAEAEKKVSFAESNPMAKLAMALEQVQGSA